MAEKIFLITWMETSGTSGMHENENEEDSEEYIAMLHAHGHSDIILWKYHPYEVKIKI